MYISTELPKLSRPAYDVDVAMFAALLQRHSQHKSGTPDFKTGSSHRQDIQSTLRLSPKPLEPNTQAEIIPSINFRSILNVYQKFGTIMLIVMDTPPISKKGAKLCPTPNDPKTNSEALGPPHGCSRAPVLCCCPPQTLPLPAGR